VVARKKTKVEIIPMIDTMFFLLVFFILTSIGLIKPEGSVKLPEAATGEKKKPANVVIAILPDQSVKVGTRAIKPGDDISTVLKDEITNQIGSLDNLDMLVKSTVTIQADKTVPSKTVVAALNAVAQAGVGQVTIATGKIGSGESDGASAAPPAP